MTDTEIHPVVPNDPTAKQMSAQVDFFAPGEKVKIVIHENANGADTWVEVDAVMTEGARKKFLNAQTKMATIAKNGDQKIPTNPGDIRTALLTNAIVGWNLVRDGRPFTFTDKHLKEFLEVVPVTAAKKIEDEVFRLNPGLSGDATRQDLLDTIEECERLLAEMDEQEGKENT